MKMTRREKLQEAYEDALFALLMEDVIEEEGQRLMDKNEQLKRSPSSAVPDELNERCMKTIRRAYGQRYRKEKSKRMGGSFTRAFSKVAVVAVICMLLFSVAYAVSPDIQAATLNLLIEISDVKTILSIESNDEPQASYDTSEAAQAVYNQFGYRIPEMPDEFTQVENLVANTAAMLKYENPDSASITFTFTRTIGGKYNVDTENAQRVENISVNGFDGLLVAKGSRIQITWANTNLNILVSIVATEVSEELLLNIIDIMATNVD